jgi:type VI secretion system secreted protein VgrG
MTELATLVATDVADDLRVVAFRGSEALCRPYQLDVHFTVRGGTSPDLARAVGSRATLTLQREEGAPFLFHGVLATARLLAQTAAWSLCEASLVPSLWRLGLTKHSRVFTKMPVPDIIKAVLESADMSSEDFELRLDGNYEPEELVVQYQESKLDFLHRWMEHEGLYYFFEQGTAREKLVIVDHRSFHAPTSDKKVRYFPLDGHDVSAAECFDTFTVLHRTVPGKIRLGDYDYARPMLDVSAAADVSSRGFGEVVVHAGRFFDPAHAKRFARIRAEELKAREVVVHAAGTALHMSAGYLVDLADHPQDAMNTRYLITEVQHFGNQLGDGDGDASLRRLVTPLYAERYRAELTAVDASLQYRAPRATPWPRIYGYESAIVDGPADSQYAQLDEQGRYLVKLHFDESDLAGDKASTWVRMMQPHGGAKEGFHFPLRKGTEVVVNLLGGDPDRPVIAGVVPNAVTPSPVLQQNATQNVIRTGSGHQLLFEDSEGGRFINLVTADLSTSLSLHADTDPKIAFVTNGDAFFGFSGNWVVQVDKNLSEQVTGDVTEKYGTRTETVTGLVDETYEGGHNTTVTGDRVVMISSGETRRVGGLWSVVADGAAKLNAPVYTVNIAGETSITTAVMTQNAGVAQLKYGMTSLDWGATTGTIGSFHVSIPGGVTITTPSWDLINPKETWAGALFDGAWAKKAEITGFTSALTGVALQVTGLNLEYKALLIENEGINLVSAGIAIKNTGPSLRGEAIRAQLSGLYTFT